MSLFYTHGGGAVPFSQDVFQRANGSLYTTDEYGITREVHLSDAERARQEAARRDEEKRVDPGSRW